MCHYFLSDPASITPEPSGVDGDGTVEAFGRAQRRSGWRCCTPRDTGFGNVQVGPISGILCLGSGWFLEWQVGVELLSGYLWSCEDAGDLVIGYGNGNSPTQP